MKVGIIGQAGGWHVAALQAALARRGHAAPCFPITKLTARLAARPRLAADGECLDEYDTLFVRGIPGGSLEQIIFRVINSPAVIERTVDKYYTSALLEATGLPTPRTVVTERFDEALAACRELGGDVVIKPLFGSEGRGMVRVSDSDVAYRVCRALELGRYVYYVQEFVPHGCEDIRAFVIGGEVVAAMVRHGETWKTNMAQGAAAQPAELDDGLRTMAVRAARALGATYAGVDILPLDGGRYSVLEVNGIPGWRGLQAANGVDVADRLVDYVLGSTQGGGIDR
jgi:RimK family alpha-L-glutamate ligase